MRKSEMISLNDYLFSGNTVLEILHQYSNDLRQSLPFERLSRFQNDLID